MCSLCHQLTVTPRERKLLTRCCWDKHSIQPRCWRDLMAALPLSLLFWTDGSIWNCLPMCCSMRQNPHYKWTMKQHCLLCVKWSDQSWRSRSKSSPTPRAWPQPLNLIIPAPACYRLQLGPPNNLFLLGKSDPPVHILDTWNFGVRSQQWWA